MNQQLEILIPGTARARNKDPYTSYEAAESVRNITETHNMILTLFQQFGPMSDFDLLRTWNITVDDFGWHKISESGLRSRRAELVAAGYVVDTGERDKTPSGRSCIVWKAAE